MSESGIPEGTSTEATPEGQSSTTDADSTANGDTGDGKIVIDGVELTGEQIRELQDGGLRQADYTRKTQELAEQRRQLEAEKASWEASRANRPEPTQAPEDSDLDQYVPGLTGRFSELEGKLDKTLSVLEAAKQESDAAVKAAKMEDAWEDSIATVSDRPFVKKDPVVMDKIRGYMEEMGWEPNARNADAAYWVLNGVEFGVAQESQRTQRPRPAMMGGTDMGGVTGATPGEVPHAQKPISQRSFQDQRDLALNHPDKPPID